MQSKSNVKRPAGSFGAVSLQPRSRARIAGVLRMGLVIALFSVVLGLSGCATSPAPSRTFNANMAYLEEINRAGPAEDPRVIFLLMAEYLNSNQEESGIRFFQDFLEKHGSELQPAQKSLYLAALGLLRANHAERISLVSRIGWVEDSIEILEEAKSLSNDEIFVVRWIAGVVYAQLPGFFDKETAALEELTWALEHLHLAPDPGWAREIYYQLGSVYNTRGDEQLAQEYLALSGYARFGKSITLVTASAVNARTGHTFHPKEIREIVPGKIFVLSGYEFTEYYFIVSRDEKELIAIDAGTRPDAARAAFEDLSQRFPGLPPLTTVFVTHAHWDHVGAHRYFRELNPEVVFYARDNYREELELALKMPFHNQYFFGTAFDVENIRDFVADETVTGRQTVEIGGSRFELIPIEGGETADGMFVYLPDHDTLFGGDFIMPFIGAPFVEEGNFPGLLDAIDIVTEINPRHLLHGHTALTRNFGSPPMLARLKGHLQWLAAQTLKAIAKGAERSAIHHMNLIAPGLHVDPTAQIPYLVLRENVINRLFDQHVGYWESGMIGMEYLSPAEYGTLLVHYLGLSEQRLATALEEMINRGDHALAAKTVTWAMTQYPHSDRLMGLKKEIYLKLKEKNQVLNPFKFIVYSERIQDETPQLQAVGPESAIARAGGAR